MALLAAFQNRGLEIASFTSGPDYIDPMFHRKVFNVETHNLDPYFSTEQMLCDQFIRGKVPMTKSEVRAVCLSKLSINPDDVAYDIGCGTGSVTIEMAFSAYDGKVYAFDKNEEAIELLNQNCQKFHLDNVEAICGLAPDCLKDLPVPDVAFIGGSSGNMDEIVSYLYGINDKMRFVITAVTLENAMAGLDSLKNVGIIGDIVQVAVSKGRQIGDLHMLMAQNPIFIISGCDADE